MFFFPFLDLCELVPPWQASEQSWGNTPHYKNLVPRKPSLWTHIQIHEEGAGGGGTGQVGGALAWAGGSDVILTYQREPGYGTFMRNCCHFQLSAGYSLKFRD